MKYGVYCIRDIKVGYLSPVVDVNDAVAMRNFEHAIMRGDSVYNSHAADFALYKIGEYDSDVGVLSPIEHEKIMEGVSVV